MEVLGVLLSLVCVGAFAVLPIVAVVWASQLRTSMRRLQGELSDVEGRYLALEREVASLRAAVARSASPVAQAAPVAQAVPAEAEGAPAEATQAPVEAAARVLRPVPVAHVLTPSAPVELPAAAAAPASEPDDEESSAPPPDRDDGPPVGLPPPGTSPPRPGASAELPQSISFDRAAIWLLAGLGGLGVVVAGLFFYDVAVERGIITPGIRYALGLVLGVGLMVGAEPLWRRDYRIPAAAVAGAGVGLLYAALYAGYARYDLVGNPTTFALMAGLTVVAALAAVGHDSLFLAVLGAVGGYATPVMLSTGENRAVALFTYVAVLNTGLLAAARRRDWPALVGLVGLATLSLQLGWAATFHTSDQVAVGLLAPICLSGIFLIAALLPGSSRIVSGTAATMSLGGALAISPFLLPLDPPDGGEGMAAAGAAWLGVVVLLGMTSAWLGAARRAGWATLAGAAVVAASGAGAVFAVGQSAASTPALWPVAAGVVGLPLVGLALSGRGPLAAPGAGGALVGGAVALLLALVADPLGLSAPGEAVAWAPLGAATVALGLLSLAGAGLARLSWAPILGLGVSALALLILREPMIRAGDGGALFALAALLYAAFVAWPFLAPRDDDAPAPLAPWFAGALSGPAFFWVMYAAWVPVWGTDYIGVLPAVLGAVSLVAVRALVQRFGADERDSKLALFAGVALLFLAGAIPVQLSDEWITIGWALEVAALAWLCGRLTHPLLKPTALVLAGLVVVRLLLNPAALDYHPAEGPLLLNWMTYTWGVPALSLLFAAWRFRHDDAWVPAVLRIGAILLLFALLNLQVAHAFAVEGRLSFSSDDFAEEVTRSLSWAAYGVTLLVIGLVTRARLTRVLAFCFLLLAAGKVGLLDLWSLGGFARVGSVAGLSVFLMVSALLFRWIEKRAEAGGEST